MNSVLKNSNSCIIACLWRKSSEWEQKNIQIIYFFRFKLLQTTLGTLGTKGNTKLSFWWGTVLRCVCFYEVYYVAKAFKDIFQKTWYNAFNMPEKFEILFSTSLSQFKLL